MPTIMPPTKSEQYTALRASIQEEIKMRENLERTRAMIEEYRDIRAEKEGTVSKAEEKIYIAKQRLQEAKEILDERYQT